MIEIQYDDRPVLDALLDLQRRMGDLTPAMRAITGVMAEAPSARSRTRKTPPPASPGIRSWPAR